jgi:hypothetical protein
MRAFHARDRGSNPLSSTFPAHLPRARAMGSVRADLGYIEMHPVMDSQDAFKLLK